MYNRPISINDLLNPVEPTGTPSEQGSAGKKRKMPKSVESMPAPSQSQVIVSSQQLNLASTSTSDLNPPMIPVNHSYGTGFQPIIPDRQAAKVAKHTVAAPTPTGIGWQPKYIPASIFNVYLNTRQNPTVIQQPNPQYEKRKDSVSNSVSTAPLQSHNTVTPPSVKEIEINGRYRFSAAVMNFNLEAQQALQDQANQFLSQEQQAETTASQQSKKKKSTHDQIPRERAQWRPQSLTTQASVNGSLPGEKKDVRSQHLLTHAVKSLNPEALQALQDAARPFLYPERSTIRAPQTIGATSVSTSPVYETTTSHSAVPTDGEQPVNHPLIMQQPVVTQTTQTMTPSLFLEAKKFYYPCEPLQTPSKNLKIILEPKADGKSKFFVEYPLANGQLKKIQVIKGNSYHMNKLLLLSGDVISFEQLLTLEVKKEKRKLIYTISGVEGQRVQVYTRNQLVKNGKQGSYFYPTDPLTQVGSDVTVLEEKDGELTNHYVEYHTSNLASPIKIPVYDAGKSYDNRLMFSLGQGVTLAQLQTLVIEATAQGKKYFVMKDGQRKEVFKHYTLRRDIVLGYQKNASELKKETKASVVLSSIFNQSQVTTQTVETTVQTMTPTQK